MRSLVLYYSNTGNTQKVAQAIAESLGAELAEVTCQRYLRWYGPVAMAWDIFTRNAPRIDVLTPPNAKYDLVVIGGPVWAARPAPPMVSLLRPSVWDGAVKALFVTCNGMARNSPPEPAIAELARLNTGPLAGTHIFREADIRSGAYQMEAEAFARQVRDHAEGGTISTAA